MSELVDFLVYQYYIVLLIISWKRGAGLLLNIKCLIYSNLTWIPWIHVISTCAHWMMYISLYEELIIPFLQLCSAFVILSIHFYIIGLSIVQIKRKTNKTIRKILTKSFYEEWMTARKAIYEKLNCLLKKPSILQKAQDISFF